MGSQIVFYFVLWVTIYQMLRTTDLNSILTSFHIKSHNRHVAWVYMRQNLLFLIWNNLFSSDFTMAAVRNVRTVCTAGPSRTRPEKWSRWLDNQTGKISGMPSKQHRKLNPDGLKDQVGVQIVRKYSLKPFLDDTPYNLTAQYTLNNGTLKQSL